MASLEDLNQHFDLLARQFEARMGAIEQVLDSRLTTLEIAFQNATTTVVTPTPPPAQATPVPMNLAAPEMSPTQPAQQPIRPPSVWKVPTVSPPVFDGKARFRPAHEAQGIIDNYLHDVKSKARVFGFRGDNEPERGIGHVTYAQWAALGLTDLARAAWRRIPENERQTLTWTGYSTWIRDEFSSSLTLTQAIKALMILKQKSSAAAYSQQFNELVAAINTSEQGELSQKALCVLYLNNLKPHLTKEHQLFEIEDDLNRLQREAERLDDITWRIARNPEVQDRVFDRRPPPRPNPNQRVRPDQRADNNRPFRPRTDDFHPRNNDAAIPMELDNLEKRFRPLTDAERREYDAKGWCKFCREHDHTIENCRKRQAYHDKKAKGKIHNLEVDQGTQFEADNPEEPCADDLAGYDDNLLNDDTEEYWESDA